MLASGCACTGDCGSAVSGHYFGTITHADLPRRQPVSLGASGEALMRGQDAAVMVDMQTHRVDHRPTINYQA